MSEDRKIIVVAGPTAVGKTKFSIEIAKNLNGEIVSADSMQLYKYMNIGSAKPTASELAQAPHHLVDQIDPRDPFSVAEYQRLALPVIEHLFEKGKTPVISGGTGLYINSLIYKMDFAIPPADMEYRRNLEHLALEKGREHVHQKLMQVDPDAAKRIHPNNLKKVIRALEVAENSGSGIKPFSEAFAKTEDYDVVMLGLCRERQELYNRIDLRVDMLLSQGLVKEVQELLNLGLHEYDISMKGIGYKEIIGYFQGNYDLAEASRLVKQNSRNYAKRQLTWFKRYENMKWFNISEYRSDEDAVEDILLWLSKKK